MDEKSYKKVFDRMKGKIDFEILQLDIAQSMSVSDLRVAGGNQDDIDRLRNDFNTYFTERTSNKNWIK